MSKYLLLFLILGAGFNQLIAQNTFGIYAGPTAGRFLGSTKNAENIRKSEFDPGVFLNSHYELKSDSTTFIRFGLSYQYQQANLYFDERVGHFGANEGTFDYQFHQIRASVGYAIKLTPKKRIDTRILFGAWGSYYFGTYVKGNSSEVMFKTAVDTMGNEVSYTVNEYKEFDGYDKSAAAKFGGGPYLGWSIAFPLNEKTSFLIQNECFVHFGRVFRYGSLLNCTLGFGISYNL